jgi:hypothetical protein
VSGKFVVGLKRVMGYPKYLAIINSPIYWFVKVNASYLGLGSFLHEK